MNTGVLLLLGLVYLDFSGFTTWCLVFLASGFPFLFIFWKRLFVLTIYGWLTFLLCLLIILCA
jgi:hypothetical protein